MFPETAHKCDLLYIYNTLGGVTETKVMIQIVHFEGHSGTEVSCITIMEKWNGVRCFSRIITLLEIIKLFNRNSQNK